jgi:hypothetical protein
MTARIRQRGCGRFFFGGTMPEFEPYRSEAEIEEVVRRFESCEYQPEEFIHASHLTVTAWYFLRLESNVAEERIRAGLQRFIRYHGKNGFHVTITEFWLRLVRRTLREAQPGADTVSRINKLLDQLNNKNLIYEYYSREQLETLEAKAAWVKPCLNRFPDVD